MKNKIKVAYIEDHKIVKEGVIFLLSQYPEIEMIEAPGFDSDNLAEFISRNNIDVLILDLLLAVPKGHRSNGIELCEAILAKSPSINIIAHSMYDDVENVNKFFAKGGIGFVSKKSGHKELVSAIRAAAEGKRYLCEELTKKVKNPEKFINHTDEQLKAIHDLFTKAEKSVLEKISKGFSTKQIAQQLEISEKTVETHRKHLFEKTGVKNVAELIAFCYSRKIFME
jgi:DNA-binding NarL/FixJ family response regulator